MSDSPSPGDERLRALLEDNGHIDDAGFSDRVARALPQTRRARSVSYALVPAFATLGCVLAFAVSARGSVSHLVASAGSLTMVPYIALALALALVGSASLVESDEI
jgi:hypothetical protein